MPLPSSCSLYDVLAMIEIETAYPDDVARFDELTAKEKQNTISEKEKKELTVLETLLQKEFDRIKLHYMLNFPLMSKPQKEELIRRAHEYVEKLKKQSQKDTTQSQYVP